MNLVWMNGQAWNLDFLISVQEEINGAGRRRLKLHFPGVNALDIADQPTIDAIDRFLAVTCRPLAPPQSTGKAGDSSTAGHDSMGG